MVANSPSLVDLFGAEAVDSLVAEFRSLAFRE
jgi:hypothetical protein